MAVLLTSWLHQIAEHRWWDVGATVLIIIPAAVGLVYWWRVVTDVLAANLSDSASQLAPSVLDSVLRNATSGETRHGSQVVGRGSVALWFDANAEALRLLDDYTDVTHPGGAAPVEANVSPRTNFRRAEEFMKRRERASLVAACLANLGVEKPDRERVVETSQEPNAVPAMTESSLSAKRR